MKLFDLCHIIITRDKNVLTDIITDSRGRYLKIEDESIKELLIKIYRLYNDASIDNTTKKDYIETTIQYVKDFYNTNPLDKESIEEISFSKAIVNEEELKKSKIKDIIQKLINFFSEFNFEPNFRFINTLCLANSKSTQKAQDYIKCYFELSDNQWSTAINDKISSLEFKEILNNMQDISTEKKINKRFKIYYGSQGTGKTTKAMHETDGRCMVCHSAMLPSDLMEDFKFNDGKAGFEFSALANAMIEGNAIVLDEINLLPFESLRFLQSILDGKSQFIYKGQTIEIKDGFEVIGTMNLTVNNSTFALPEPLVDRAYDLVKYKLTADDLLGAII